MSMTGNSSQLEILNDPSGIPYLRYENPLHGLTDQLKQVQTYSVTEAASELGRAQAILDIKKSTVEASDGSEVVFQIEEHPSRPSQAAKGKKA
jgi:hypothetical protein